MSKFKKQDLVVMNTAPDATVFRIISDVPKKPLALTYVTVIDTGIEIERPNAGQQVLLCLCRKLTAHQAQLYKGAK